MFISLTVLNRVVLNDQMTSEEERNNRLGCVDLSLILV